MKRLISCLVAVITLFSVLSSCSLSATPTDEEKIESCIESFKDAYNDGDLEEALNYMTGKQKNALEAMLSLIGMFSGYDASAIFSDLFALGVACGEGDFMEVKILNIAIDGDEAKVTAIISFPGTNMADNEAQTSYFHMVKKDGEWLIADITD